MIPREPADPCPSVGRSCTTVSSCVRPGVDVQFRGVPDMIMRRANASGHGYHSPEQLTSYLRRRRPCPRLSPAPKDANGTLRSPPRIRVRTMLLPSPGTCANRALAPAGVPPGTATHGGGSRGVGLSTSPQHADPSTSVGRIDVQEEAQGEKAMVGVRSDHRRDSARWVGVMSGGAADRRFRVLRRNLVVVLGLLIVTGASACGDRATKGASSAGELGDEFALPFGLIQVAGTRPIGRPAVFDDVGSDYEGPPTTVGSLEAAYEVVGDDPVAVFRSWVDQLKILHVGEVTVQAAGEEGLPYRGPWLQASGYSPGFDGDDVDLQLWTTGREPVLLVQVTRYSDDGPETVVTETSLSTDRPKPVVDLRERTTGDVLFEEQGQEILVPDGSRPLMGTIPNLQGQGGASYSLLAAEDGAATVQSLLEQAILEQNAQVIGYDVTGPDTSSADGVEITRGSFRMWEEGYYFHVVAVQAAGDPWATVYVTSGQG